MKLFETIDGLLKGTKYLGWAIGLVGIVGSIILFFANLSLGFASAMVFIAALLLSIAVTLLLMPQALHKGFFSKRKQCNVIGAVALVLAAVIMGIIYFSTGAFPELNLLFV